MTDRYRKEAQDLEKYDQMVTLLSNAQSKEELEGMAVLYIMDMNFPRPDICLALKAIEHEKGW